MLQVNVNPQEDPAPRASSFMCIPHNQQQLPHRPRHSRALHTLVGNENLRDRAAKIDREIENMLGTTQKIRSPTKEAHTLIPEGFRKEIILRRTMGDMSQIVAAYYLATLSRGDSPQIPGQGGRASLLQAVLTQEAVPLGEDIFRGREWKEVRPIGQGAYASVILWEKTRDNKPPLQLAVKESHPSSFFRDYCSEGHLTRRLNDAGCRNVINVVEWLYLPLPKPRHRICYEYAQYSDLRNLELWYRVHKLILPEAFIWHIFHSVLNALTYCRHGTNEAHAKEGWDTIIHGDIKEENLFLITPDTDSHHLYPRVMLADFGLAYTQGGATPAVQHYRSTIIYGTDGYIAPEIEDQSFEKKGRRRAPHELHGPHSDIYSLGKSFDHMLQLVANSIASDGSVIGIESQHPPPQNKPKDQDIINPFYSPLLLETLKQCTSHDSRERPKTYALWQLTRREMLAYRKKAYAEEAATSNAISSSTTTNNDNNENTNDLKECFHNSVLFTPGQHSRYENDTTFRQKYREVNLAPLAGALAREREKQVDAKRTEKPIVEKNRKGSDVDGRPRKGKWIGVMKGLKSFLPAKS